MPGVVGVELSDIAGDVPDFTQIGQGVFNVQSQVVKEIFIEGIIDFR